MLSKLRLLRPPVSPGSRILNAWENKNYSDKKNGSGKNNRGKTTPPLIQDEFSTNPKSPTTTHSSESENNYGWQNDSKNKQSFRNWSLFGGAIILSGTVYGIYHFDIMKQKNDDNLTTEETTNAKKIRKLVQIPSLSESIPDNIQYLLIGGGTASFSAFRAIKSADPTARVLVISAEGYLPHMRPPLSKELWYGDDTEMAKSLNFHQWNGTSRSLFYEPEPFYTPVEELTTAKNGGISLARGWKVESINVSKKKVKLNDGKEISYDKCLIATGSVPKTLKLYDDANEELKNKFSVFRSISDFEDLWEQLDHIKSIAIIGGGFLGSELAASLANKGKKNGVKIYQIFKEKGNMGKVLPKYLSQWTTEKVRNEGVEVVTETEVENCSLENNKRQVNLKLSNGKNISVDHVIMAVGAKPNTELATDAGLEIDSKLDGYLVNSELQARTDLYIAGDCACFYDKQLGRRRVEHHDHAVISGRLAGENMAGAAKPYQHQPMFWSDIGPSVGYEAIGIVDSSLVTMGVFAKGNHKDPSLLANETDQNTLTNKKETNEELGSKNNETISENDYNKGVVFYLKNDVIVGIVLWNLFNRMSIARQVLKTDRCYKDLNEVAKLFNIHGDSS
ncbi:apoptosis-inducing factor 1, mitochondrial isoform X2 [Acyrthosiphon pisum]|uniref:Apoptosis-inducing factor 1, mitochondrial n=1 Tax=Acyrthosiphon pisum TaxID=7029 RepID=A0A8R1W634_ACYPI|nr:apoptosis-inducing factor 1, mitochondrial isoform X2 [Acyrthosiphon pisum]|eukprot:XP_001947379.1 PREDICTED: apoptosis-inducing factor 1, mitochondrial [Acyrthosiphon pisum]